METPGEAIPDKVCGVCGRYLDGYQSSPGGPVDYRHTGWDASREGADDHPPVPVDPSELPGRPRCDFCHADLTPEVPGWIVPVALFGTGQNAQSNPDWLACDDCVRLVETDQWSALVRRAVQAWEERHAASAPSGVSTQIGRLYRQVRKNMTGTPRART